MSSIELPRLIGGKYRPLRLLGQGAMGTVYAVEHVLTGEQLALKVMTSQHVDNPEAVERFKREARASARIKSEHVVRIIDADVATELGEIAYLVMDLLDGLDLEQVSGDMPQPPATVVEWLRQVARALDKAHRIGIVHRDLKPENLFLTQRENGSSLVKVLDFGIAKIATEPVGTTQSGELLGTPMYMSPEQARADGGNIGPASDLYSLGLIAYKLLNGKPYWNAPTVARLISLILYEPLALPSERGCELGSHFDAWFLRACHRDPARRFASAAEQIEQLSLSLGLSARTLLIAEDSGGISATEMSPLQLGSRSQPPRQSTPTFTPSASEARRPSLAKAKRRGALWRWAAGATLFLAISSWAIWRGSTGRAPSSPTSAGGEALDRGVSASMNPLQQRAPEKLERGEAKEFAVAPQVAVVHSALVNGPSGATTAATGPTTAATSPTTAANAAARNKALAEAKLHTSEKAVDAASAPLRARVEKPLDSDPLADQK